MTVGQIAIRQEIRQMLNEAGINKNTLRDMVKEVLSEEIERACYQALKETNLENVVSKKVDNHFDKVVREATKDCISERVNGIFHRMQISVDITDKNGISSITR